MESNTTVQDNNPEKRAIIPDIMSQLDYGDNDPNLSSESVMYTPKDERTPSESLKKAKELEKSLPISKKEKAAVDALLDMYVLDETKEKEIAMNIDKKSRKIRKRYTSSPSNLVLKLSIEKDGKYKLKRGGKRRNRKIIPLTQYGGSSPQIEFFKAIDYAIDNNVHNQSINITIFNLVKAFLSPIDINARCGERDTEHIPEHFTALHYCCLVKNTELVRLLLENGAILMGPELLTLIIQQQHPLDHVTEENKNLEIATMLLDHEHTYDINKDDFELFQRTSMHLLRLRTRGHAERTRNYNKEYKAARKTGLSPKEAMSVASEAPSPDIPPPRDSDGTRLGYVNSIFLANGSTALHNATYRAQPSVVRLLLERGANIDAKTQKGRTPLMLAQETLDDTRRELDRLNATVLQPSQDVMQNQYRLERSRNVAQILVDKLEETISVLNEYSAKKNTKSILIDQLQTTLDLPKDDPNRDPEDTRPKLSGHDGKFIKKIKSYLGGNRTRNLLKYKIKESVLS